MERLIHQQLSQHYHKDLEAMNLTDETIRNYQGMVTIYLDYLEREGGEVLEPDREMLLSFIRYLREERDNCTKRVKYYFTALNSFYDYLVYTDKADQNPIPAIRKRYLKRYKNDDGRQAQRMLISVPEMAGYITSIMDPRDRAIAVLLAKTGIRRGEMLALNLDDVDWDIRRIRLHPTPKRSNLRVYFDDECARVLQRWLQLRSKLDGSSQAIFLNQYGDRLHRNGVYRSIVKWAKKYGIYDTDSDRLEDHFTPHCFRHWFTTHLLRAGMPREYVAELRGDSPKGAIDIYNHIDHEDLRKQYLAHIPQLGLE